jgi:glycerate kinase
LGDNGAVHVFGPQKGVAAEDLDAFEQGMAHYAALVVEATGRDLRGAAGSGAAGGIGYGLRSFLDTVSLRDGFSLIAGLGRLREAIRSADLVITGEGKLDSQSLYGKVPVGIARIAREEGTFAAAFAGKIEGDPASFEREGLQAVMPIIDEAMPLEQAMADSEALLTRAGRRFMAILRLGRRMAG